MNAADIMRYLGQIGKVLGGDGGVKKGLVVLVAAATVTGAGLSAGVRVVYDRFHKR